MKKITLLFLIISNFLFADNENKSKNIFIKNSKLRKTEKINIEANYNLTSLIYAVSSKDIEYVKSLITDKTLINKTDPYGRTALMYSNDANITNVLIKNGAKINITDEDGRTALMLIHDINSIKILLKFNTDINAKDNYGKNALMYAKDENKVKLLIEYGININDLDYKKRNALMFVENKNSAKLILDKGIDVNSTDNKGKTALMYACELEETENKTNYELILFLLNNGANKDIKDINNKKAIDYAKKYNKLNIENLLTNKKNRLNILIKIFISIMLIFITFIIKNIFMIKKYNRKRIKN